MTRALTLAFCIYITLFSISLWADEYRPAYLSLKKTTTQTFDIVWKLPSTSQNRLLNLSIQFSDDVKLIKPKSIRPAGAATIEKFAISSKSGLIG